MIFNILAFMLLYLCFGVFTWQFWFLFVIANFERNSQPKEFDKFIDLPLFWFLFLWPLTLFYMGYLFILLNKN